jgi:aryl-alcohol dehydrogenase-like predicted oxidoreductase
METIKLGKTGYQISRLGLGGCPLGGHGWGDFDREQAIDTVHQAVDAGINFFDTADIYGLGSSEELLSYALGEKRHRLVIASKFGVRFDESTKQTYKDISPKYARKALEASLKRLRLEMIPLYYVHWSDGKTPIQETVAELEKCRQEGKIGGIGLSNFTADEIADALSVANIDAVQVQFSIVDRELAFALFDVVQKNNITLVTWGSLAQGFLSGKYDENSVFDLSDRRSRSSYVNFHGEKLTQNLSMLRILKKISQEIGMTLPQLAIRWLLDTIPVGSVLFGAKNAEQVKDNLGIKNQNLNTVHYQTILQAYYLCQNRGGGRTRVLYFYDFYPKKYKHDNFKTKLKVRKPTVRLTKYRKPRIYLLL